MKKIIKFVSSIVIGISMFTCVANASINNFDNRGFTYVDYTSGTYECTPYILGDFPICFEDKEHLDKFVEKNLRFDRKINICIDDVNIYNDNIIEFKLNDGSIATIDKLRKKYVFKVSGLNNFDIHCYNENELINLVDVYINVNRVGSF